MGRRPRRTGRWLVSGTALAALLAVLAAPDLWLGRAPASRLQALTRLCPRSARVQYHLGRAYARHGWMAHAVHAWETALQRDPRDLRPLRALAGEAVAYRRWEDAEGYLARLLARAPDDAWAHLQRGVCRWAQGDVRPAMQAWKAAVRLDPRQGEAWYRLGLAATRLLQYQQAIPALERAIELLPRSAEPLIALGRAYLGAGRLQPAERAFQRALEREPGHPIAHRFSGQLLYEWRPTPASLGAARAHLEAALRARPDYPEASYWLARACLEAGEPEPAERHLRAALAGRPLYAEVYFQLGRLCLRTGRDEEGGHHLERFDRIISLGTEITHLRDRIALDPEHPEWHLRLARALVGLGWRQEALREYEQTLALAPEREDVRREWKTLRSQLPGAETGR